MMMMMMMMMINCSETPYCEADHDEVNIDDVLNALLLWHFLGHDASIEADVDKMIQVVARKKMTQ